MKKCSKCHIEKHEAEFGADKLHRDGLRSRCKSCNAATTAAWRVMNPGKANAKNSAWKNENQEKIKAYSAKYYKDNAEELRKKTSEYRSANIEKTKACLAAWRAANAGKIKAQNAAYRAANKTKVLASSSKWRAANKDHVRANNVAWRTANPGKALIYNHNRRALKLKVGGILPKGIAAKLFNLQRGKCACCKRPLGDRYHLDHIMPLALGGKNEERNIQLLRNTCNLQKHAKHPVEFMQQRGFLI